MHRRLCVSLVLWLLIGLFSQAMPIAAATPRSLYTIRQRFGVGVASGFPGTHDFPGRLSDYAGADQLGFGWYSDWTMRGNPEQPNGIEFVQLLDTSGWPPAWQQLEAVVRNNPSALWIIGNEPETRGQGRQTPAQYAERYHDAYYFIKNIDPDAQVAIGGVVMPTPLRLRWLDMCLDYYQQTYGERMPVDVWNIHVQILQEKRGDWGCGIPWGLDEDEGRLYEIVDNCNVDIFKQLIYEFCAWLKARGERNKPLIISEFGVLMPSSYLPHGDQSVIEFMEGTFDFLLTARDRELGYSADGWRLVQRWLWFSLNFPFYDETPGGFNGALYDWQHPDQRTQFGEYFAAYVQPLQMRETVLSAVADTHLDATRPTVSFGDEGRLRVGSGPGRDGTIGLVYFDLSALPDDALIVSAELSVHVASRSNPQGLRVRIGPAAISWDEETTYLDALRQGLRLREPTVLTSIDLLGQRLTYDVTPIVQAWRAEAVKDHGFMLDARDAGNTGNVTYSLASSEWLGGAELGPQLEIAYLTRQTE